VIRLSAIIIILFIVLFILVILLTCHPEHTVIQTTEGRKNLGSIKWMFPRFFASL